MRLLHPLLLAGLSATLAAETAATPDPAGAVAAARAAAEPAAGTPTATRTVAFLGVSTIPAAPELRKHLGLKEGFGLRVVHIEPGSPAATAGLAVDDILVKLGTQELVNAEQLRTLIRASAPGDAVVLACIRAGKTAELHATLTAKTIPEQEPVQLPRQFPWKLGSHEDHMTPEMRRQLDARLAEVWPGGVVAGGTTMILPDGNTVRMTQRDGKQQVEVKGADGALLYDGPADAPEAKPHMGGLDLGSGPLRFYRMQRAPAAQPLAGPAPGDAGFF